MGYYINPPDMPKELWLHQHAVRLAGPAWPDDPAEAIVCLIDNGPFRAARICYSRDDMEACAAEGHGPDQRPRTWWRVPKDKLYAVSEITEKSWK